MSQRSVERVVGRLVTDEAFREQFAEDPGAALRQMTECGVELTDLELRALASIDARVVERIAGSIDPRIQKICVHGKRS
jgi:putative modified peptide